MAEPVEAVSGRRQVFRRVMRSGACALSVLAAATALASSASAQSDQARADARAAATDGFAAFNAGRFEEALQLFKNAESLVHAPPHLLYQARASVKLGHLVAARELYRKLSLETIAPEAPGAFRGAQAAAQQELPEVEAKIPFVKIQVEGQADDTLSVTMDGTAVPTAVLGVSRPIDPGEHQFLAKARGWKSELTTVKIAEAAHETVSLKLLPAPIDEEPPAPAASAPKDERKDMAPGTLDAPPANSGLRIAAAVTGGVGLVGIGFGTVFALSSSSKRSDVDNLCKGGCPVSKKDQIVSLNNQAGSAQTLALVSFIAGGAALATGGVLFYLSLKSPSTETGPEVHAYLGPGNAGVSGRF